MKTLRNTEHLTAEDARFFRNWAAILSVLCIATAILLISCAATAPKSRAVSATSLGGIQLPAAISGLATTQGCSTTTIFAGYGIPPQLSQNAVTTPPTSVDFCKSLLSTRDAAELQIYFNVYGGNILLDGVHNAQTCPILFWYHYYYGPYAVDSPPTITAAQYAAGMLTFLKNKRDQDLIGKKAECNAALQAAGLPLN